MSDDAKKIFLVLKRNFYVRAGVLIVLLVLFVFIFVLPAHDKTKQLAQRVDNVYLENRQTQGIIIASGHSGQKLEHIQTLLQKYQQMVRPRSELSYVLDKIASRAQAHGLEVVSLKPLNNVPYAGDVNGILKNNSQQVYEVVISMKAKGHFMEVGRYVSDLEEAPFKIIIKNLALKTPSFADNESKEPELSVKLVLSILMLFSGEDLIL